MRFFVNERPINCKLEYRKKKFHFRFFRGNIDNPQIDPKMGNFHSTGTMVIKRYKT